MSENQETVENVEVEETSVTQEAPSVPQTRDDKLRAAVEAMEDEPTEVDEETEETEATQEEEEAAPAEPVMKKSEYYEKLAAYDRQVRQLKQEQKQFEQIKQIAQSGDIQKLMSVFGLSLDQAIDAWAGLDQTEELAPEAAPEVAQLRGEIQQLRKEQEQSKINERVQAEFSQIDSLVRKDSDRWEMIATQGAHQLVFDTAVAIFHNQGRALPYAEVMDLVEQTLVEEAEKVIGPLKKTKKLAGNFSGGQQNQPRKKASPTISSSNSEPTSTGRLSREEKLKRAALRNL